MKFKLAVENVVLIAIKLSLKEGSVNKLFSFTLTGNRKTPEEMEEQPEQTIKDFLIENITDWSGQRLVLLESNEPAPFSPQAFEYMLKQAGVLDIVWQRYKFECGAKEKN